MQPYFFPYLGYWQLINTVDRFVIYDDVNFIKGGWINRNRILINGKPNYITAPLYQASPNKRICDISLQSSSIWREKMTKSIENTYRRAPFFSKVFPIVEKIICYKTDNLAELLLNQIRDMSSFLGIQTNLVESSRNYKNNTLAGEDRVLDICKHEGANTYINLEGGQALYNIEKFSSRGIKLCFIVMNHTPYSQRSTGFINRLSIIDTLMELGPQVVIQQLKNFKLTTNECSHV